MSDKKTRVLIADDHALVRRGFQLILSGQPDLEVVATARDGTEAVELTARLQPDLVVIDVSMEGLNGIEATRRICEICPNTRVLAVSMHDESVYVREMLLAGALGYLVKDADDDDFLQAVRAVARGEGYLGSAVSAAVLADYRKHVRNPLSLLSSREREVLQLIAEGRTNKEVANRLEVSIHSVDHCRDKIIKKLDLHNPGDLVRFAVRNGLIS